MPPSSNPNAGCGLSFSRKCHRIGTANRPGRVAWPTPVRPHRAPTLLTLAISHAPRMTTRGQVLNRDPLMAIPLSRCLLPTTYCLLPVAFPLTPYALRLMPYALRITPHLACAPAKNSTPTGLTDERHAFNPRFLAFFLHSGHRLGYNACHLLGGNSHPCASLTFYARSSCASAHISPLFGRMKP